MNNKNLISENFEFEYESDGLKSLNSAVLYFDMVPKPKDLNLLKKRAPIKKNPTLTKRPLPKKPLPKRKDPIRRGSEEIIPKKHPSPNKGGNFFPVKTENQKEGSIGPRKSAPKLINQTPFKNVGIVKKPQPVSILSKSVNEVEFIQITKRNSKSTSIDVEDKKSKKKKEKDKDKNKNSFAMPKSSLVQELKMSHMQKKKEEFFPNNERKSSFDRIVQTPLKRNSQTSSGNLLRKSEENSEDKVLLARIVFYQKKKSKLKNSKWIPVIEDFSRVSSPEILEARNLLEEIILSSDNKFDLLVSVIGAVSVIEADQLISSVVNVFQRNKKMKPLWEYMITEEIKVAVDTGTLFRSTSLASKLMKFYSNMIGLKYLSRFVKPCILDVICSKNGFEIDPNKVDDPQNLSKNLSNLLGMCEMFLNSILESYSSLPLEMKQICNVIGREVGKKFPESKETAIGGYLFLRQLIFFLSFF